MQQLKRLSLYIFLGLLAYMPLHIFLSTWLGTSFGLLSLAKVAKDIMLVIGFGLALASSIRQPWFTTLLKDKLVWLITGYGLLTLALAAIRPTDTDAEILGVVYNLRYLVFFGYGALLAKLFDARKLVRAALGVVLITAVPVLLFGVIQYTVLPNDALERVGYSRANGVLPAFFIDDKPDLERVMSTLRDPNSFGSYIIIIASLALALLLKQRIPKELAYGLLALAGLSLIFTFSRSAWLGMLVALLVLGGLMIRQRTRSKLNKLAVIGGVMLLLGLAALFAMRDSYFVRNVIFHADESTVLEDPNQLRLRFWRESAEEVASEPLGSGPGTAGLASIRNDVQGVELNENYYLQIASEVGVIGLLLFLAIISVIAWRLYGLGGPVALGLLAALAGLSLTNFLVHIWSNEAVAYTWWGLAGVVGGLVGKDPHAIVRDYQKR